MDAKLIQDLSHFCMVYRNNMEEILRQELPASMAGNIAEKLEYEFSLFETSMFNRLHQDLG